MTCPAFTSAHDGLDVRRYFAITKEGRVIREMCRGCGSVSEAMGAYQLDRRSDPDRPDREQAYEHLRAEVQSRTIRDAAVEPYPSRAPAASPTARVSAPERTSTFRLLGRSHSKAGARHPA